MLRACSFVAALPSMRKLSSLSSVAILSCAVVLVAFIATPELRAQENGEPYFKLKSQKYVPASQAGGKQLLRLKVDIGKHIPTGAKIQLKLMHSGLFLEQTVTTLEIKGTNRKGVLFDWVLKKPLSADKYSLFVALPTADQTPAVLKKIRADKKGFPPNLEPWAWSFDRADEKITVGTAEELAAVIEEICDIYDKLIGELSNNNSEFLDGAEAIKKGKKIVKDGELDPDEFKAFLKKWRKKQAATQKKILDFQADKTTIFNKTLPAYAQLHRLGQMVSKRSYSLQLEIEKQYNLKRTRIVPDPKVKADKILSYFGKNYRLPVTPRALGQVVDGIYRMVCPAEEEEMPEEEEAAADPAPKKKAPAAKKKK